MLKTIIPITILIIAYIIGVVVGCISGMREYHTTDCFPKENHINPFETLSMHERCWFLFKNNIVVSLKNLAFGALSLGLFSIPFTFYNGFVLGCVIGKSTQIMTTSEIIRATLPHSFEFIGIVLYGYLGYVISLSLINREVVVSIKKMTYTIIIATIIILIAAIIENYVSMS